MERSPRLRQLLEHIKTLDQTIKELKAEREALKHEIEAERVRWELAERERLIALGFKALLQIESGMSLADSAKANDCSRAVLKRAIDAWRRWEGLAPMPKPCAHVDAPASHRAR